MGIFDALNTSVGGLQAQSFALQNISGNIANASTTGYKGIDTSFEDLIPDATTPNKQVAGGVTAFAQSTITTQGTVTTTTVATNMAINGDGFFSVQKPSSTHRQRAGVLGHHRLHPPRRLPGQRQRQSGERRRLLSDGRHGRPEDRQPDRQRAGGAAIPEQLHPGAGDLGDPVRREPADHAEDPRELGARRPAPSPLPAASIRPTSPPTRCRSARPPPPIPTTPSPDRPR